MTPEYETWRNMHKRCNRRKTYIAKGIKVCARWFVFENFLEDMGERPLGMTLERINNSDGYSELNCRWATQQEQMWNTGRTRWIIVGDQRKSLAEWCALRGLNRKTVTKRLQLGWSPERALEIDDGARTNVQI